MPIYKLWCTSFNEDEEATEVEADSAEKAVEAAQRSVDEAEGDYTDEADWIVTDADGVQHAIRVAGEVIIWYRAYRLGRAAARTSR